MATLPLPQSLLRRLPGLKVSYRENNANLGNFLITGHSHAGSYPDTSHPCVNLTGAATQSGEHNSGQNMKLNFKIFQKLSLKLSLEFYSVFSSYPLD